MLVIYLFLFFIISRAIWKLISCRFGSKSIDMGKCTFAPFMGQIVGTVGNGVFQRSRAGNTIREKVVPINPKSSAQISVRGFLASLSKAWAGLTDSQRGQWDTAAASAEWTQKNAFGEDFQLSGEQLYLKLNLIIDFIGETRITTPPSKATFDSITLGTVTATAGTPSLSMPFTGSLSSNFQFMISASQQVSQGIMSTKSVSFRNILNTTGSTPIDLLTAYNNKFGTLVEGRKIYIRLEIASDLTGESLLVGETSVIVAA